MSPWPIFLLLSVLCAVARYWYTGNVYLVSAGAPCAVQMCVCTALTFVVQAMVGTYLAMRDARNARNARDAYAGGRWPFVVGAFAGLVAGLGTFELLNASLSTACPWW